VWVAVDVCQLGLGGGVAGWLDGGHDNTPDSDGVRGSG
jgi:hypothetical protein